MMESLYHIWLIHIGKWNVKDSLPLELCSVSLILTVLLLFTRNRMLYNFVFFLGIGGALQAILTPVLDLSFPHFRFIHFFYTHTFLILVPLYFTWVHGFYPTFRAAIQTMIFLNCLLPFILVVNFLVNGNYMFLHEKPEGGSLLDFLGDYPWYIGSLEVVVFVNCLLLWLIFRERMEKKEVEM